MAGLRIRTLDNTDMHYVRSLVAEHFASDQVVSRGRLHRCTSLPGFVALIDGNRVGLVQYCMEGDELEVVTLISQRSGIGVGKHLVDNILALAAERASKRCWLVTTNNNFRAIRFYEKLGWTRVAIHENAVDEARKIKPDIPEIDSAGVPIRDEWEFELRL